MYCLRSVGREPGRFASSTRSCSDNSFEMRRFSLCGDSGTVSRAVVEGDVSAVGLDWSEEGLVGRGCEMAFWPVMIVPSWRPAEMWWLKLELMAGITWTFSGTPVMEPSKYIADSKDPVKRRAPVRKRLPTEADWKLKTEEGRARFTISRLMVLRNERMSSRLEDEIADQRWERPSTMESHSSRAAAESEEERRWLKIVFMAVFSGVLLEGMRRTSRPVIVRKWDSLRNG